MFQGEKVLAIIPARAGSKGIKNKNLIDFGGRPLLEWSIDAGNDCVFIDDIAISSDSNEILSIGKKSGLDKKISKLTDALEKSKAKDTKKGKVSKKTKILQKAVDKLTNK